MRKILNIPRVLDYFFLVFLFTFVSLPIATYLSTRSLGPSPQIFVAEPDNKVLVTLKAEDSPPTNIKAPYKVGEKVPVKVSLKPVSGAFTLNLGIFSTTLFVDKDLSVSGNAWLDNNNYAISFFQKSDASNPNYNEYVVLRMASPSSDGKSISPVKMDLSNNGVGYLKFYVTASKPGTYKVRLKNDDASYKHVISDGSDAGANYFDNNSLNNELSLVFEDTSGGGSIGDVHLECVNNTCTYVDGPGQSTCSQEGASCGDNSSGGDSTNPVCGDGAKDFGEECDDGNTKNGDGCSSTCTIEKDNGTTPPDTSEPVTLLKAKNLLFTLDLEGRNANNPKNVLKFFNPTVFVGLWRPSQKKFVITKIVESPESGQIKINNFFKVAPEETDVLVVKPESYLSKSVELKTRDFYTLNSNGDLELKFGTEFFAGDVIIDIGTFDSVNVRDYVFYRSYFGSGKDYIVYFLDYNGNNRVDIFDFNYYRANIGRKGATEKYGLKMVEAIEDALKPNLYKVIKNDK